MCWLQQSAQLWYYPTFLLFPLGIIAAIECFAGYHAWKFLLGVNGAVIGLIVGATACAMLAGPMLAIPGAFVGMLAGVALFVGVERLGSCLFTIGSVASLVIFLGRTSGIPPPWIMGLAFTAAPIAAIATLAVYRPAMIVIASIAGAQQIASAWCAYHLSYTSPPTPDNLPTPELAAFLTLSALGCLTQFFSCRMMNSAGTKTDLVEE